MPLFTTLADNFNDNVIGPNWGDSYGGVSEVGGRARVPVVAGAYAGYQTGRAWTLAGASIYLKLVTKPAASTGTDVQANFSITSPVEGTSVGFKYNAATSKLRMQSNVDYFDGTAVEITYDPVAHLWLRIREDGTNTYWDTAPNGSTWTNRRTLATPAWVTAAVDTCALDLFSFRDAGVSDITEYDNVNTMSDGAVYTGSAALAAGSALTGTAAYRAICAADLTADGGLAATEIQTAVGGAALAADFSLGATLDGADVSDIDHIVGRPYSGWAVSAPWR